MRQRDRYEGDLPGGGLNEEEVSGHQLEDELGSESGQGGGSREGSGAVAGREPVAE